MSVLTKEETVAIMVKEPLVPCVNIECGNCYFCAPYENEDYGHCYILRWSSNIIKHIDEKIKRLKLKRMKEILK